MVLPKQTGVWVTPRQTAGQFEQEVSTPFHQSVDEIKEVIASTLTPQLGDTTEFYNYLFLWCRMYSRKNEYSENSFGAELPQSKYPCRK